MGNDFNDYVRQLQELENAENIASLKALREMNEGVLSFFPLIWESINKLISSNSVPLDIIDEIKKHLTSLSNCKRYVNTLSSSEKSKFYANNIAALLYQRYTLTIYEAASYERELSDMISKNEMKIKEEKDAEAAQRRAREEAERRAKREREEAERRAKIEAELKAKNAKKKEPKQYLYIGIQDISSDEYIEVFVDGIKDASSSKYADHEIIGGGYWNQSLEMSNAEHTVSLHLQLARIKLEIFVPKIDFSKEGRKMNTIDYHISSSSLFKKWTSDPSKIDVKVWLQDPDSWSLGRRINPNYRISHI